MTGVSESSCLFFVVEKKYFKNFLEKVSALAFSNCTYIMSLLFSSPFPFSFIYFLFPFPLLFSSARTS
jgi:hypothetical protein